MDSKGSFKKVLSISHNENMEIVLEIQDGNKTMKVMSANPDRDILVRGFANYKPNTALFNPKAMQVYVSPDVSDSLNEKGSWSQKTSVKL
jgi:hypothetical protein